MSIIIENGVVKKCAVSENLIIPEGVTEIADEAFYHNENIKTVVLPNGIKRIGNRAFMQCYKLEKINLPDSITEIGEDAFHECLNLKKIKLPDGIKRIERGVFRGCVTLNEIDIPKTVEVIEPYAFINVPWLKNLIDIERNSETNMVILGDNILYRYVGEKSHVCIPDNIKSVAERAFSGRRNTKTVTIPGSVKHIGEYAFYGIEFFETDSGSYSDTDNFVIANGILFKYRGKERRVELPESIKVIGESVFENNYNLENVLAESPEISIAKNAFCNCINMTDFDCAEKIVSIEEYAFANCSGLLCIDIISTTKIAPKAFMGCKCLLTHVPDECK